MKVLCITSLARLDSWMASFLEDMASKKKGLKLGGNETVMIRKGSLELLTSHGYVQHSNGSVESYETTYTM